MMFVLFVQFSAKIFLVQLQELFIKINSMRNELFQNLIFACKIDYILEHLQCTVHVYGNLSTSIRNFLCTCTCTSRCTCTVQCTLLR